MKHFLVLHVALGAALLLGRAASAQDIPEKPEDLKYKPLRFDLPEASKLRAELPNGVVVYAMEDRTLPRVDIKVYVKAGAFWAEPGKEGVAQMTGTLMRSGGTKTRKPEDLDEELDFLAAELGVDVGETGGTVTLSALSKDLDRGLEILFDVLRNPAFAEERFELLKAQTMEALKTRNDNTATIEQRETDNLIYGDFPLNRRATGKSIESLTREDLIRFHERFFQPWNFIIAASGDVSREDVLAKLGRGMGDWESAKGEIPAVPPVTNVPKAGVYCFNKAGKNITQGRVTIAELGIDIWNPDAITVQLMSYILGGGGLGSRLTRRVRGEMGLAYEVYSDFRALINYRGKMRIALQSKNESCALAAKVCLEEVDRIRQELVSEEELAAAKQFFIDAFPAWFANASEVAATYAVAEMKKLPKDYYATYRDRIKAVTREDIKRVAGELLHPDKMVIVVVGNIPAIKEGNDKVKLADLGRPVVDVPLADPVTLERPGK